MLQDLHIKDFAIIEEVDLNFYDGMTVLTGETGAGKSIIIDAVGLLAGGRGSAEFVRHGAKKCQLEGEFLVLNPDKFTPILDQFGISLEDNILLIQREIFASGRNVCRVNGSMVTVANLKEIASNLIDIHGQNEHQELMQADQHIELLDNYAGEAIKDLKQVFQAKREEYLKVKKRLQQWQANEKEYAQRIDMLEFQVKEIEAVNLEEGEDEALEAESRKLANFHKISQSLQLSYDALQASEGNAVEKLGMAMEEMSDIASVNKDYEVISDTLSSLFYQVQETSSDILNELDQMEFDEGRLYEIEDRLKSIQELKRKYGDTISEVLTYYHNASEELYNLKHNEGNIDQVQNQVDSLEADLVDLGQKLHQVRQDQAEQLEQAILDQLAELYMDKARFSVEFKKPAQLENMNANGFDTLAFYISTNPGEPLKPLNKVASGGELSRMMLAMKTIFSSSQGITSIIFDEVDTGVSGRVASAIAKKIHGVSDQSQVLCITHLPQVAAIADEHLYINKQIVGDRTKTQVSHLSEEDRVEEIARMLSGDQTTPASLSAAQELLKKSL